MLSLLSAATACQDELPPVHWEGEHILFAADHPEQVCGGTLEYLDRRTGQMLERLGADPGKVTYYYLDDVSDHCPSDVKLEGCVFDDVIYSVTIPHLHEIVHTRAGDGLPGVLEEGLAAYQGDPYPILGTDVSHDRLAELLVTNGEVQTLDEYTRAGHFVAFLVETFGLGTLLELDDNLPPESSFAQLDAAFQRVLGVNVDGVLELYEAYPECLGTVDTSIACAEPPVPQEQPFVTRFEHTLDCTASDGIGPHRGKVFVEGVIDLDPALDNTWTVSATGDGVDKGGFAVIRRCGACPAKGIWKIPTRGPYFIPEEELPPGRYLVRLYLPVEAGRATVGLRISG